MRKEELPLGFLSFKRSWQPLIIKLAEWFRGWKTSSIWWTIFALASTIYGLTSQTSVSWQDSGTFQWRILEGDFNGTLGLAVAHPLLILAGQIAKEIPLGNLLWRLNFMSGLGMAIALANFMALLTILTNRRWIAVMMTAVFGLSHAVWWLATITETYTWVVAGLTLELLLLAKLIKEPRIKWLLLLALVNGLTFSIHDFAILSLPVDIVVALYLIWRKRLPVWSIGLAAMAYLVGGALYISMIVKLAIESGSIAFALSSAFFGKAEGVVLNTMLVTQHTAANAALASLSFANVIMPMAILGWFTFRRFLGNPTALALGAITLIEVVFILRYNSEDQFTSMLPAMTMITLSAAVGATYLAQLSSRWRNAVAISLFASMLCMPILYGFLPSMLRVAGYEVHRARMLPLRDEMRYWITPWKNNEDSGQLFADAALRQAAPDGVILSDATPLYPLLVARSLDTNAQRVEIQVGKKPLPYYDTDPDEFRKLLGQRTLYVVSALPGYLSGHENILRDAEMQRLPGEVLYKVKWK